METLVVRRGKGRTRITVSVKLMGKDLILCIYNEEAHIGAAALADYDHKEARASTSLITRLGHKDDVLAYATAHKVCRHTKKPVCVVAGIHVDNITEAEITQIVKNTNILIDTLLKQHREFLESTD
jgi:hypothetical protein